MRWGLKYKRQPIYIVEFQIFLARERFLFVRNWLFESLFFVVLRRAFSNYTYLFMERQEGEWMDIHVSTSIYLRFDYSP